MSEYAATFALIDTDNDGRISADELVRLMAVLDQPLTATSAQEAIAKVDSDGDGLIDLAEFERWLGGRR